VTASEAARDAKEIELKLAFDPADASRILSHPVLAASHASSQTRELISIYYDTGDDVLRKAGVFLRVREIGERYVQTIKSAHKAELLERFEWEQEVPSHEPDLDAAEGTALAPLLTPEVRAALRPRFHTRVWRKTFHIVGDAAEIEVAIDQGEITAGVQATPISELELELKAGHKQELFHLARDLAKHAPLQLAVKTKAERGFELLDGGDYAVEKATDIEVTPELTSEDAFRAIARNCLRQIVANVPAVRDGRAEALHQMRIGLRRLRVAIRLFAGMVEDPDLERIKGELKWITRELGPARDLDVFETDVLEPLRAAHPADADVIAAQRDFAERRAAAYARAKGAVDSDRFRLTLLDLAAWLETGAWADDDDKDRQAMRSAPITEHAAKALSKLRKRIKKGGQDLRELSVSKQHKLRIRAKRLRYATEFFAVTFPGKKNESRRQSSLSALKDLQDFLGTLNDLVTRPSLLGARGEGGVAPQARAPGVGEEAQLLADAERAYARFTATNPFWK
jgi:triphosphatase